MYYRWTFMPVSGSPAAGAARAARRGGLTVGPVHVRRVHGRLDQFWLEQLEILKIARPDVGLRLLRGLLPGRRDGAECNAWLPGAFSAAKFDENVRRGQGQDQRVPRARVPPRRG